MKAAHSEEMWQLLACGDHSGGGRSPHTNLKVSVRLGICWKRTTDVRSNTGVYFTSNKCAQRFEVVAAATLFIEISGDCSDKEELQQRAQKAEQAHRHSVAELKAACRWLSWSSSSSSPVMEQAHPSVTVTACREPSRRIIVSSLFQATSSRSFLSVRGDSQVSPFEGTCFKHLGQEEMFKHSTWSSSNKYLQPKGPQCDNCGIYQEAKTPKHVSLMLFSPLLFSPFL